MRDLIQAMNKTEDATNISSSDKEIFTIESENESELDEKVTDECVICEHPAHSHKLSSHQIQSEMEKFMKLQEAGLGSSFKCPKCRSCKECLRGPGKELISMQMEAEQELIKDSISIDLDKKRALVFLAFTADPETHLKNNMNTAVSRLRNVCRKYSKNPDVHSLIVKGFEKLLNRGHIIEWQDLTSEQRDEIERSQSSYFIPWDVGFKETSLSTPARPTFDASSKTSTGSSLNDILAKGSADLVNLVSMVLDWLVGPSAVCGDISQFYNTVLLEEQHWKYQQVVWYDNLDPTKTLRRGVIRTCIYGVKCVGSQTEEIKRLLARLVEEGYPEVAEFLVKFCYVDDLGRSNKSLEETMMLIRRTEEVLGMLLMSIKGWGTSGKDPPAELSDDGKTVGFAGMTWAPKIDCFKLNLDKLHFGKKRRGRYPDDLKKFDGSFGMTMEEFVPKTLTRLMCTSVTCRIYDIPGKLAPLTLRLKHDLRKLIKVDPDWNNPISDNLRLRWIENFHMIEDLRDVMYVRCNIPSDALRKTVRIWLKADAADGGLMIVAHSGNERPAGRWSCNHLFSKGLLAPPDWSTPKLELHALSVMANIYALLMFSLGDWVEVILSCSDSTIALSWTIYEKVKLQVFHRMRVSNIRNKIDMENLFHVDGKQNLADLGTRPDLLTTDQLMPSSEWILGKPWMQESLEKVIADGILKNTKDIKLDNDAKKTFREAIIYDTLEDSVENKDNTTEAGNLHSLPHCKNSYSEEDHSTLECEVTTMNTQYQVFTIDAAKTIERENYSDYIYPPLKRGFRSSIRIIALVLKASVLFKKKLTLAKIRRGEAEKSELAKLNFPPVRFTAFHTATGENISSQLEKADQNALRLTSFFRVNGVKIDGDPSRMISITDKELSASLEYLYKKAAKEVFQYNDKKSVDRVAEFHDGILYCKTRLLEGQTLRVVGDLKDSVDLQSLTGVNFRVPVMDRHSPLALSIALHLHYNVVKHKGYETVHRISLQFAKILQGRVLMKDVSEDCIFCKKLRLDYLKQVMGPLSDLQLSVSPVFYYTYIDAWGPLKAYVPGFERETRSGTKTHQLLMVVFACAATGMINCQIMEGGKKTGHFLDVFNRFIHECCVPKICLPDQDGAMMKALLEGEVDIRDQFGVISRERGVTFQTCVSQGHSAHGRVERRIRMIQECLDRSGLKATKLHSLGWQTIAKTLEHDVNSIPLGFLQHQTSNGPLLRVLTPNSLKLNSSSNRAPSGLFTLPNSAADLMDEVEKKYNLFYKIWNEDYIPLIADRQKWHFEAENLKENDLLYFKLSDSMVSSVWKIGKVEYIIMGNDNMVRKVGISYKQINMDTMEGEINVVERPVRECVRLFNIEDTSLLDDIQAVRAAAEKILDEGNIVPISELDQIRDDTEKNTAHEDPREVDDSPKKTDKELNRKKIRKRKTEIENLKIENWKEPSKPRRPRSNTGQLLTSPNQKSNPLMTMVDVGYISSAAGYYCPGPEHDDQGGVGVDGLQGGASGGCHEIVDWERCFSGVTVGADLDANEPVFLM